MARPIPIPLPGVSHGMPTVMPTDAVQQGVHSDLRKASAHRKKVSGVLHLKKESIGRNMKHTAFTSGKKAFNFGKGS